MSAPDRDWILSSFKNAVQILAAPVDAQLQYFPDFVCVTDELALDFDHWQVVFISNFGDEATREQLAALAAIDERLDSLSRGGSEFDENFWTDEALRSSARWEELRHLAARALTTFGFPVDVPINNFNDYVRAGSMKPD